MRRVVGIELGLTVDWRSRVKVSRREGTGGRRAVSSWRNSSTVGTLRRPAALVREVRTSMSSVGVVVGRRKRRGVVVLGGVKGRLRS